MAADRIVKCINEDGVEVEFREDFESPYVLKSMKGVHSFENNISSTDNTMVDGATYQGTVAKKRNIVLYIKDMFDFYDHRNHLNSVFKKGSPIKVLVTAEDTTRKITGYVESINGDEIKPGVHFQTISIICTNPFFTTPNPAQLYIANWLPNFEWQHEFLDVKEEFGFKSKVRMRTIRNVDAIDNVGMTIRLTCTGAVVNPVLRVVERNEHIKLGSDDYPFTMSPGDVVEIMTESGNKHVYYTHDGKREEQNFLMTEDSTYIQLQHGTNSIGYDAQSGVEYMVIRISYGMTYQRA